MTTLPTDPTDWPALVAGLSARFGGQSALARHLGVGRLTVWRWCNGKRTPRGLYARELLRMAASPNGGQP